MTVKAPARESRTATARPHEPAAVELAGVSKVFEQPAGPLEALGEVSLTLRRGETVALVGPSGCGKSTLLEIVAGLESPTAGRVSVDGVEGEAERLRHCALMPQKDSLLPWRSALDNAGLALELQGASRAEARRQALALFADFGLEEFARTPPGELSGGMRQRVAFARTLLAGRSVLLLDEPFASLDSITRAELQEWLLDALARDDFATLLVTHDIEEALFLSERVLVLSRRPGTVRAEISAGFDHAAPRAEVVASPRFSALRRRALEALA